MFSSWQKFNSPLGGKEIELIRAEDVPVAESLCCIQRYISGSTRSCRLYKIFINPIKPRDIFKSHTMKFHDMCKVGVLAWQISMYGVVARRLM